MPFVMLGFHFLLQSTGRQRLTTILARQIESAGLLKVSLQTGTPTPVRLCIEEDAFVCATLQPIELV